MLDFINQADDPDQLADWFVSMSLQEFESVLDPSDIAKLQAFLRRVVDQDPYMQARLQWLSTFLSQRK